MTKQEEVLLTEAREDVVNHYGMVCQGNSDQGDGIMVYAERDGVVLSCMGEPKQEAGVVWHNFRKFDVAHARVLIEKVQEAIDEVVARA